MRVSLIAAVALAFSRALGAQAASAVRADAADRAVIELERSSCSVVGAASAADSTSPQFWVDRQRNLLVRMIVALTPTQTFDVHLERYERAGAGWLATHVALVSGVR